jgi:hypothetical protein
MSFSFSSLVRLLVVLGLGSTLMAIGLSKLDPPSPEWRTLVAAKYSSLNEYFMKTANRTPRWIEAETGQVVGFPLEDGDVVEAAACSPWVDEKGQHQIAGRWASRTRMGPASISTDFGIARYQIPSGKMLDHVSTEIVPVGPPCWFPGLRARILFAGGDGELYHYAFEPDAQVKQTDPEAGRDLAPARLTWRCPRPGRGEVFMSDVSWPDQPTLEGYVIVALRELSDDAGPRNSYTKTGLWWLKLDLAGTEIVEVGRLLLPDVDHPDATPGDRRTPAVGTLLDGRLALAYVADLGLHRGWELRVAPIEFQGDHHVPAVFEASSVPLATDCQPAPPSFSADGRWLNAIEATPNLGGRIIRIPLDRAFPKRI